MTARLHPKGGFQPLGPPRRRCRRGGRSGVTTHRSIGIRQVGGPAAGGVSGAPPPCSEDAGRAAYRERRHRPPIHSRLHPGRHCPRAIRSAAAHRNRFPPQPPSDQDRVHGQSGSRIRQGSFAILGQRIFDVVFRRASSAGSPAHPQPCVAMTSSATASRPSARWPVKRGASTSRRRKLPRYKRRISGMSLFTTPLVRPRHASRAQRCATVPGRPR